MEKFISVSNDNVNYFEVLFVGGVISVPGSEKNYTVLKFHLQKEFFLSLRKYSLFWSHLYEEYCFSRNL